MADPKESSTAATSPNETPTSPETAPTAPETPSAPTATSASAEEESTSDAKLFVQGLNASSSGAEDGSAVGQVASIQVPELVAQGQPLDFSRPPEFVNGESVVGKRLNADGTAYEDDPEWVGAIEKRAEDIFDRIGKAVSSEPLRVLLEEFALRMGLHKKDTTKLPEDLAEKSVASRRADEGI